jgi:chaperone modulatory protein CbpM
MSMPEEPALLIGTVIDESVYFGVDEFCRLCAVERQHIVEFVAEGVLVTSPGEDVAHWRFDGGALRRARLALRLERDLELNVAGVALALDLMEEIDRLRQELKARRP